MLWEIVQTVLSVLGATVAVAFTVGRWLFNYATRKWEELSGTVKELSGTVKELSGTVEELSGTVGKHEKEHENETATTRDELSGTVEELSGTVGKHDEALEAHGGRLGNLERGQANLKGAQTTTGDRLDTIEKKLPD